METSHDQKPFHHALSPGLAVFFEWLTSRVSFVACCFLWFFVTDNAGSLPHVVKAV
jgi:hypothetical protein